MWLSHYVPVTLKRPSSTNKPFNRRVRSAASARHPSSCHHGADILRSNSSYPAIGHLHALPILRYSDARANPRGRTVTSLDLPAKTPAWRSSLPRVLVPLPRSLTPLPHHPHPPLPRIPHHNSRPAECLADCPSQMATSRSTPQR